MASFPEGFDLQQQRLEQRLASGMVGDFCGGNGGGGGPGLPFDASSILMGPGPVFSGRIVKGNRNRKPMTALEKARMEAEEVRENFKARRRQQHEKDVVAVSENGNVSKELANAAKYDKRLHMNRESAAASRARRDAYIKSLEKHLQALEDRSNAMEEELAVARKENNYLKSVVGSQQSSALAASDIDFFLDL